MSQTQSSDLTELAPGVYVIPGVTNVGVITDTTNSKKQNEHPETKVYLVDAGRTEEQGLTVLNTVTNFFNESGINFRIEAIINTHAHSDHTGADAIIQQKTNCKILSNY